MKISISLLSLCLAGCATVNSPGPDPDLRPMPSTLDSWTDAEPTSSHGQVGAPPLRSSPPSTSEGFEWKKGQAVMQGFLGSSFYDKVSREGGGSATVDGDNGDVDQMPVIGGGAQWKLGGNNVDVGGELFISLEGRANAAAFAVGGGGAAVAVDVDLLIVDIYGGAFVSKFLGNKLRAYAGIGPLMQFANYDQDFGTTHDSGSGFGFGGYARAGLEFALASRTMIGIGARWSDSTVDLGGGLGDLEIEGTQLMFTVTQGF
jgi:hypothetical protein